MAILKRQIPNDKAISVILASEPTRRVFESFADHYAASTTRLVGELGLGYDVVRAALESLQKENLIQREAEVKSSSPGMDWFRLTEEGVWVAKSLTTFTARSAKKLK